MHSAVLRSASEVPLSEHLQPLHHLLQGLLCPVQGLLCPVHGYLQTLHRPMQELLRLSDGRLRMRRLALHGYDVAENLPLVLLRRRTNHRQQKDRQVCWWQ
jgi:hypothetical protein